MHLICFTLQNFVKYILVHIETTILNEIMSWIFTRRDTELVCKHSYSKITIVI